MRLKTSRSLSIALFVTIVIMFAFSSFPSVSKAAVQATASADTAKCADAGLISGLATDAKTLGDSISKIPTIVAQTLYGTMVDIANTRLKYEDMKTPTDAGCNYLVTESIVLFANVQDFGLINMGSKLGLDTSADLPVVTDRLTKQMTRVTDLIGTPTQATPSADTFATASADTTPAKCANQALIDGLVADTKSIGADLANIPSTGAGGVYSTMINIANARLKYEDMKTSDDAACNYLITESIILFANVQDYGLINMGTKLNIDTSADLPVVTARVNKQLTRVTDLIAVK